MPNMNENLEKLSATISNFCQDLLDDEIADMTAKCLCDTSKRSLPELMKEIPSAPDIILARRLIEFALSGLNNFVLSETWRMYYLQQEPLKSVARSVGCSTKTIQRQILTFPKKIAIQLWEKSYEYANPMTGQQPMTENQKKKKFVQEKYGLTLMQSNVLLEFWLGGNAGRSQICTDLYITYSTLKSHIKKIVHRVGAANMNEAVAITEIAYTKYLSLEEIEIANFLPTRKPSRNWPNKKGQNNENDNKMEVNNVSS